MNCIDPPQGVPFTGLLVVERELKLEGGVHHLVADPHVAYLNPIVERYHEEVRVTVIVVLPGPFDWTHPYRSHIPQSRPSWSSLS